MFFGKPWSEWVEQYAQSHTHPINRFCHTVGIPIVAISVILLILSIFIPSLWRTAFFLFVLGWVFQFVGHAYERKMPEFFKDWRFLFVGLRWWLQKIRGGKL